MQTKSTLWLPQTKYPKFKKQNCRRTNLWKIGKRGRSNLFVRWPNQISAKV